MTEEHCQNPHKETIMTEEHCQNPAETMRKAMEAYHGQTPIPAPDSLKIFHDPHLVALPESLGVADLSAYARDAAQFLKPARRKGSAKLATLQSLIDWANRFKGETTALFANPDMTAPSLTCVANYHGAGPATVDPENGDPTAQHCDHRATYSFPLSKEWRRWIAVSDKDQTKEEIGQFIEDNAKDFLDPTPFLLNPAAQNMENAENWEIRLAEIAAKIKGRFGQYIKLLEMSRAFEVNESSNLKVTRDPVSGQQTVSFVNEHKDAEGQPLVLPDLFLIAIPVFNRGAAYRLPIRFQYRKSGQNVKFRISIYDPARAFDDCFNEALQTATTDTALPLFEGTPEV